ncbi:hypothetical protein UCREL1_982 [Eutypa lata UCREL1]|uniref:SRR1-like domain-containing protein n=1 Tax=Eutypa lata (strain UCR-EL1) TaxID=1287681 RepID=M7TPY0_EUTLA|nr:hypothetical protein UCREL1_982 [Eutypa lata UCREL1]
MNNTLSEPPNREFLLSRKPNDEKRKRIVIQRANYLVEYNDRVIPKYPKATWLKSPYRKEVIEALRHLAEQGRLPNVDKIVCFGLGSPAALDLAKGISILTHRKDIEVYAQDPYMTLKDINVLTRAGIKVVNPFLQEGYTLVDENTFVLSVYLNYTANIEAMTLECTRPAMIMWTDMKSQFLVEHSARTAALSTLDREYDRVEGINALKIPDTQYKVDSSFVTSDWLDYAFVTPDHPVLAETSLYIPKPEFYRAPSADS